MEPTQQQHMEVPVTNAPPEPPTGKDVAGGAARGALSMGTVGAVIGAVLATAATGLLVGVAGVGGETITGMLSSVGLDQIIPLGSTAGLAGASAVAGAVGGAAMGAAGGTIGGAMGVGQKYLVERQMFTEQAIPQIAQAAFSKGVEVGQQTGQQIAAAQPEKSPTHYQDLIASQKAARTLHPGTKAIN